MPKTKPETTERHQVPPSVPVEGMTWSGTWDGGGYLTIDVKTETGYRTQRFMLDNVRTNTLLRALLKQATIKILPDDDYTEEG